MFDYVGAYSIIIGSACLSSFLSRIWCALLKPASQLARCLFGLFLRLLRRFLCSPAAAAARSLAPVPAAGLSRATARQMADAHADLLSSVEDLTKPHTRRLRRDQGFITISLYSYYFNHSLIHSFSCCIAKIFRFEQNRVLALRRAGRFRTWPERWE